MISTRAPRGSAATILLLLGLLTAACGGSSPASTPPSEAPSATAAPTAAPSSRAPVETASAATGVGHPLAEALVAQLASEPLITHVEQTASVSTTDGSTTTDAIATMSADLTGDDLSLRLTVESDGVTALDQEMVVLGDTAYVRVSGGEWATAPATAVGSSIDEIFKAIRFVDDPSSLQYVGPEQVEGRTLHHLTGSGIPYRPAAGGSGQYDEFDIWVEDDGTPVTVASTFSATDPAGNQISGETELVFSDWGGPIEIVAPDVQ